MVKVGDSIIFVDETKVEHPALVTAVFSMGDATPGVNLIYVSTNPQETDPYGNQLKRETSQVHIDNNPARAHCWKEA